MRLTLRTLLAYLDDILEEDDARVLRAKIEESGYATDLVSRIRAAMNHPALTAPSPDAVSPRENANVMSEYLDSTLANEEVAELERFCLESNVSLAEAAACHQILTVALGEPARVPDTLRQKIQALPDSPVLAQHEQRVNAASEVTPNAGKSPASSNNRFASVEFPTQAATDGMRPRSGAEAPSAAIPAPAAADAVAANQETVAQASGPRHVDWQQTVVPGNDDFPPVSKEDSGVSDAATRLRQSVALDRGSISDRDAQEALAAVQRSEAYSGLVRPSRITPWLVSLALAAVLLFVLGQIFAPLSKQAQQTPLEGNDSISSLTPDIPVDDSDAQRPEEDPSKAEASDATESSIDEEPVPQPESAPGSATDSEMAAEDSAEPASLNETDADTSPTPIPDMTDGTVATPELASMPETTPEPNTDPVEKPGLADAPQPSESSVANVIEDAARLFTDDSLVLAMTDGDWQRVSADLPIASSTPLVVAGLWRPLFAQRDQSECVVVGPSRWSWIVDADGEVRLQLDDGRLLASSPVETQQLRLRVADQDIDVQINPESPCAVEVVHVFPPGRDPTVEGGTRTMCRIVPVEGEVNIHTEETTTAIAMGSQWIYRGDSETEVQKTLEPEPWMGSEPNDDILDRSARAGVLEFFEAPESPVEQKLREAMQHRRPEVVTLAAQTLLQLGRADVFFGTDGILNRPRLKLYWPQHFEAMRRAIAQSPEAADAVRAAILQTELVEGKRIFQMLVGYTQAELEAGADVDLVKALDNPSMPIRVLAIENLRGILGETLGYRADQDNALRRKSDIKKWEARLRRGDIRYPTSTP